MSPERSKRFTQLSLGTFQNTTYISSNEKAQEGEKKLQPHGTEASRELQCHISRPKNLMCTTCYNSS
jgi:hypothetical protein